MQPPLTSDTPSARFALLANQVQMCIKCPRMEGRKRVLSDKNGTVGSRVMFIAEAPGRLGADQNYIPLHGDKAGDNFENLLPFAGLSRDYIFITNAVLCNPRTDRGNNATPNRLEICNCQPFLSATIEIVNPQIVVSLGKVALQSLAHVSPHDVTFGQNVGVPVPWNHRYLFPLYHPGQRARRYRSLSEQQRDFQRLRDVLRSLST